jgi:hypothetical protein
MESFEFSSAFSKCFRRKENGLLISDPGKKGYCVPSFQNAPHFAFIEIDLVRIPENPRLKLLHVHSRGSGFQDITREPPANSAFKYQIEGGDEEYAIPEYCQGRDRIVHAETSAIGLDAAQIGDSQDDHEKEE